MTCPARWPGREPAPHCTGTARLQGVARAFTYDLAPGATTTLRFRLSARQLRSLRRTRTVTLEASAVNTDAAGGTRAGVPVVVRRPHVNRLANLRVTLDARPGRVSNERIPRPAP